MAYFHTSNKIKLPTTSCLLTILLATSVNGQQKRAPVAAKVSPSTNMTAETFEQWVASEKDRLSAKNERPSSIEKAVMSQLRAGKYVTDQAVLTVIYAWSGFEADAQMFIKDNTPLEKIKFSFPQSKRVINEVTPFLYGRVNLQARLYERKAYLFRTEDNAAQEVKEYKNALKLLDPLHTDVDRRRVENNLLLAGTYRKMGDNVKSEAFYLEVLSYPFWKVSGASFAKFRDFYVRAGNELIELRRKDQKALMGTYFVSSVMHELGPNLSAAIKEAGGDPQQHVGLNPLAPSKTQSINDWLKARSNSDGIGSKVDDSKLFKDVQ